MTIAFSRIEASKSAAKVRVSDAFKNEAGAFDLPSILVGVVVVGVLTAGVLASIFGVIPFAQDKGAQQNLGAITTAQGVYKAQGTETIEPGTTFAAGLADIKGENLVGQDVANVYVSGDTNSWAALTESQSGKWFSVTSANTTPVAIATADEPANATEADTDVAALNAAIVTP